jgi:hypothetical protein
LLFEIIEIHTVCIQLYRGTKHRYSCMNAKVYILPDYKL